MDPRLLRVILDIINSKGGRIRLAELELAILAREDRADLGLEVVDGCIPALDYALAILERAGLLKIVGDQVVVVYPLARQTSR